MKATAKDLRYKTKEIIAAIERGEEVLLTYRGKEKAIIVPILNKSREKQNSEEESLFGIWRENELVGDINAYLDKLRGGRFVTR